MFLHADTIVKAVMIGLAVASLVTWTVWVAKSGGISLLVLLLDKALYSLAIRLLLDALKNRSSRVISS